uniref:Uncharacterized protein n=1 Tax=Graphocephala atropunctata TaxID=36148 RepID=A0A1B6LAZ7_9HEMI
MCCRVIVLVVLFLCFHQGQCYMSVKHRKTEGGALKCYQCNSIDDPKCGDPIDRSVGLTECTPDFMKDVFPGYIPGADPLSGALGKLGFDANTDANAAFTCFKAIRQVGNQKEVYRGCSIPSTASKYSRSDSCAILKEDRGAITSCTTCDYDGCNKDFTPNTAPGIFSNAPLALLVVAVTSLLVHQ